MHTSPPRRPLFPGLGICMTWLFLSCGASPDLDHAPTQDGQVAWAQQALLDEASAAKPTLDGVSARFPMRKEVRSTLVITAPGTYDFSGILHVWKGSAGGCAQKENGGCLSWLEPVHCEHAAKRGSAHA